MGLEYLERFFAYRIEKLANSYGYLVVVWDEYSLSCQGQGYTLEEAIADVYSEVESNINNWR